MFEFDMRAVRQLITDLLRTLFGEQAQVIETLIQRLINSQMRTLENTARRVIDRAVGEQMREMEDFAKLLLKVLFGTIGCFGLFMVIALYASFVTYRRVADIRCELQASRRR